MPCMSTPTRPPPSATTVERCYGVLSGRGSSAKVIDINIFEPLNYLAERQLTVPQRFQFPYCCIHTQVDVHINHVSNFKTVFHHHRLSFFSLIIRNVILIYKSKISDCRFTDLYVAICNLYITLIFVTDFLSVSFFFIFFY